MENINEALNDLRLSGVILDEDVGSETITLDLRRLFAMGFSLIFNGCRPEFITNAALAYMYNTNLYVSPTIPLECVRTFNMCILKCRDLSN